MFERLTNEQVQEIIIEAEKIDTESTDIDVIKNLLEPLTMQITLATPAIPPGTVFYRATQFLPANQAKSLENIWYAPEDKVWGYHRVGRPNQPVFYCSDSSQVTLSEIRPKVGDLIVLSEWENTSLLLMTNTGFSQKQQEIWKGEGGTERPLWARASLPEEFKLSHEEEEVNNIIVDYFSEMFSKDVAEDKNHLYKVSAAIAELLGFNFKGEEKFERIKKDLHKGTGASFDGILFPTIIRKGIADNFAIRKHSVDTKLRFLCADQIRITAIENGNISYEEINYANSADEHNNIEWKGRKGTFSTTGEGDIMKMEKIGENEWSVSVTDKNGKRVLRQ